MRTTTDSSPSPVDGAIVGSFADYDALIAALRERIGAVGLSYAALEELAGLAEGAAGKYLADARARHLSIDSLIQIASVVGVRGVLVTDEKLLRKYRQFYQTRDGSRVHARTRAKLGAQTLKRVRPVILSELGRAGAAARNRKLSPEVRRELSRAAALARWRGRQSP